jgi:hypothetical protein
MYNVRLCPSQYGVEVHRRFTAVKKLVSSCSGAFIWSWTRGSGISMSLLLKGLYHQRVRHRQILKPNNDSIWVSIGFQIELHHT